MPKFPHINANEKFPYLDRAKPFDRTTDFDYERYDYTAEVKLCSVSWPSDYRHTVYWESPEQRDSYFASLDGHTIDIEQGFTIVQTQSIVVDVPLDIALAYNYMYTQVPRLTVDAPIRHESTDGVRTICAFVTDCRYLSPSTTELTITIDIWTTYLPYLGVRQLVLRRGHAPMHATSASAYLADPVNNCAHLLTPDVNFGGASDVVRSGSFMPLSTAEPIYVIASTIPYADISSMAEAATTAATAPVYGDLSERNGHQVDVSGYDWNTYGSNSLYNPSRPTACVDGSTPSGLYYYGFYASAASSMRQVLARYPLLAKTCAALYVVPSDLVTIGTAHTVSTITFYEVRAKADFQAIGDFTLTKSLFGYPAKYAEVAKLYTDPYASLELSDDLGNVIPLKIENCSHTLEAVQHINAAFPFLSWEAMIANYASKGGRASYTWCRVSDGVSEGRQVPNADFAEVAISFGIDTFELRMDAWPMTQLDSYFDAKYQREAAINAYQAAMRSANNALENAEDSNATANTNALASNATANTNALASNATANTNSLASNATANTNAINSNTAACDNALDSNTTAKANADRSASNAKAIADINADTVDDIATEDSGRAWANYAASYRYVHGDQATTGMKNKTDTYTLGMHNAGINQTAISGLSGIAGNLFGGNAAGAMSSALSMFVTISHNTYANDAGMEYYDWQTYWQDELNDDNTTAQSNYIYNVAAINVDQIDDIADANKATANSNANATKITADINANRTRNTGNANANRTKATADANANRTKSMADANANRTKSTADANANRTKATADANAGYTRATAEVNAKNALLLAQDAYTDRIQGAGIENPMAYGESSGDGLANGYRMRGLHLRAKTQSDSAIARAGDTFLRFGYAYDGIWTMDTWCDVAHDYCYWQARDLWMSAADVANPQAERGLEAILEEGVTVWRDPDMIGAVEI